MKNQKNERGITLVALVVTIVVLLILAGITIMYVMSDNGIFGKATDAKTKTNKAVVKEAVQSAVIEATTELYDPVSSNIDTTSDASKTFDSAGDLIKKRVDNALGVTSTLAFSGNLKDTSLTAADPKSDSTTKTIVGDGHIDYNGTKYYVVINTGSTAKEAVLVFEPEETGYKSAS